MSDLKIRFDAKLVKIEFKDNKEGEVIVEVQDKLDFITQCVTKDETLAEFLNDVGCKKYLLRKIGCGRP